MTTKTMTVSKYLCDIPWDKIKQETIDCYPWYEKGLKQATYFKVARTEDALHIKVDADDIHSSAAAIKENDFVYMDSCFEFFFTPEKQRCERYINLEVNCIGTPYLAVRDKNGKRLSTNDEVKNISISPTLKAGEAKEPSENDESWSLMIVIPFDFLEGFYEGPIDDQVWYCNFYRCGGSVDDQYASWSPLTASKPNFHLPLQFGEMHFE